jgi:glc operon protein GlcG
MIGSDRTPAPSKVKVLFAIFDFRSSMHNQNQLSHQDAQAVLAVIQAALEREGRGAAVAVVDDHGELIAFLRTDGCPLPSVNNAIHKAYTAARERKPSGEIGRAAREQGFPITNFGDLRYTGWGGGVPIVYQGAVIGAVGVSGLPEDDDIELARLGVAVIG